MVGVQGSDVTLLCGKGLRSNPPAIVGWLDNNGNSIDAGSSRISVPDTRETTSLSLGELTERDSGNWTCQIAVPNVRTVLIAITLTVLGEYVILAIYEYHLSVQCCNTCSLQVLPLNHELSLSCPLVPHGPISRGRSPSYLASPCLPESCMWWWPSRGGFHRG